MRYTHSKSDLKRVNSSRMTGSSGSEGKYKLLTFKRKKILSYFNDCQMFKFKRNLPRNLLLKPRFKLCLTADRNLRFVQFK